MPIVRTVVRSLIAGVLAVAVSGIAGSALAAAPAASAAAQQGQRVQSARTERSVSGGVTVSIDSVSPQSASAKSTITVTGTITNNTGAPLTGAQVQLLTSQQWFTSRSQMDSFSGGQFLSPLYAVMGTKGEWRAPGTFHSGTTMSWTASFPAGQQGYTPYEVYPVEAVAVLGGSPQSGGARTFLPYWPASGSGAPKKLDIAWIWPLIDEPQQTACEHDLATNKLASSLAAGGRLNGLLAAGLDNANSTSLTWAVDPALLSDANVMNQRYKVGGNPECTGTTGMPASHAAVTWLNSLRTRTAGQPMFLTPYADPDVSALTHAGLHDDLSKSYALGDYEAQQILSNRTLGQGTRIAWPAGGEADASVLTSLAHHDQVGTAVLSSDEMPALPSASGAYPPDNAVASVTTGTATTMGVLLADSDISTELNSASAASPAATQFSVEQDFLAQTAMIVAEAPNAQRSVVIAPPRRWDPSESEAAALLQLTSHAPWLQPTSLATLASQADQHADKTPRQQPPGSKVAPQELSKGYIGAVKAMQATAGVYSSLLYQPSQEAVRTLQGAIAATESSAWRGKASRGGRQALSTLSRYLTHRVQQVQIVSGNKVVLAGASGTTPVSVSNGLDDAIQVKVVALLPAGSKLSIGNFDSLIIIGPQETKTVGMPVNSAALGSTLVKLQLVTENGTAFGPPQSLNIESTRFGRALLIVIGAALGVLLLASLARWTRRRLRDGVSGADGRSGGAG
jgi:hypothetical protein